MGGLEDQNNKIRDKILNYEVPGYTFRDQKEFLPQNEGSTIGRNK